MPVDNQYRPSLAHADLGDGFFDPVEPARFPMHRLRWRNQRWAARVGLASLTETEWEAHFARFEPLPDGFPQPLALRYHGHQFRHYNPEIGDGRGFLFAQLHDGQGRLLDLGTKGSGQTPYSRFGDGRLTLKGGLREVMATELLEAFGVYTSKSFSLFETGEALVRGDEPSPTRSSVLTRLSHSHVRIGTFQRQRAENRADRIAALVDHCVRRYMPEAERPETAERAAAFFAQACRNIARMGAQWMAAGFVHGVLNTDNTVITGESFDYGPYRFLPRYDPRFTAAYFDEGGLYAFGRQPASLLWNLQRLAECLLPICPIEPLQETLERYDALFADSFQEALTRRLGVERLDDAADTQLAKAFFSFLHESGALFEQAVFDWRGGRVSASRARSGPQGSLYAGPAFAAFEAALGDRAPRPDAGLDHPYFKREKPCSLLYDEIEAIWASIAAEDDWTLFSQKMTEISEARGAYGVD
ncbi:MAG: protein adenylyltransferase SelO [Elsteraceae bacterium]